ncbi:C2H2-type zinc finger transcription factor [Phycomyces blakesleeanus]|uniref:C2H2-type zinc finger transcription factor n=2 Tax=Phycomyces blakesleeanus TaxID=4837 RepID=A0A162TRS4_PHYB8|nr:C2H2-type zinc finger transcription factor [Phycomyces blakesleeanus NRRL 1555(-)]OAD69253.1 C2H2-type zinc finger transcription factor [Phycomyces blakesleeanus NRRL 1555(-)]|eukprot:XP_018287293.1 C2H2-type zinc finger transcription factor [Phycomyces blakesleeanus NRRL 1555(-)]
MSSAYGSGKAQDTDFRKKWDKDEYAARAKLREEREREHAKNAERKRQGLPPIRKKEEEEEPRELLKPREEKVVLDANLGKTVVVQGGASGEASRQPGFYCKACDIVVKDSANYLDHINGRKHQKNIGISMKVERASIDSVKERLAMLKRKKEEPEKEYDLDSRVAELKREEDEERRRRKEKKRQKKEAKKRKAEDEPEDAADISEMMGFSGFGSSKQ